MSPTHTAVRGLLSARTTSYREHLSTLGPVPGLTADQLVALIGDAGLTGRGGGGFPTSRKLGAVASRRNAVVIANGAEGEPASSKDRVLLQQAPHLVLDGLALAARAVRARSTYLYAAEDLLERVIAPAIRDRAPAGGDQSITLVASPDTFVSGQESAAVAAVQGLPARPLNTPPPVFVSGVRGRPTLVQNVETLAHLALVARYGSGWFRAGGTVDDPGTRLVTLSGAVARPGVYEVTGGAELGMVIAGAGGPADALQALLVGGYHGGWVPWNDQTERLPMTREALRPYGASPGAGVVIALPSRECGLTATAALAAYLAGENAGQCGPCRNGLPTIAGLMRDLADRRVTAGMVEEVRRVAAMVDGRGACAHPDGTVRLVRSALRTFDHEVAAHLADECTASGWR